MSEQAESGPVSVAESGAEHLTDQAAGGLLLAFLTTVLLVLAAASFG